MIKGSDKANHALIFVLNEHVNKKKRQPQQYLVIMITDELTVKTLLAFGEHS